MRLHLGYARPPLALAAVTMLLAIVTLAASAAPPLVVPFSEEESLRPPSAPIPGDNLLGPFPGQPLLALEALADRLADLQADITEDNANNGDPDQDLEDGGWDWTLAPGTPEHSANASFCNLYGPITKGVVYGYKQTGLGRYLTTVDDVISGLASICPTVRAQNALYEALILLSEETGDASYATFARNLWDDFLLNGSGGFPGGTAEAWAQYVHAGRQGQGIPELAPWDVNLYIQSALALDRYFPGNGYDTQAADMAQEIADQIVLGTWDPNNTGAAYYTFGIIGTLHAYVTTGVAPGDVPGYKATVLGFDYDVDLGGQGTAYALMALVNHFPGDIAVASYVQGGLDYLSGLVAANGDVVSAGDIIPEEMGEVASALYESATDLVAADTAGLCISTATTCVTVPVVLSRLDTSPARAVSVTIQLSSNIELCGAITQGDWLEDYGSTFQVVGGGGGIYTVDQSILGEPCGVTDGGTLFTVPVRKTVAAGDGTATITVTAVDLRNCGNPVLPLPANPGAPASIPIDTTAPGAVTLTAAQDLDSNGSDGTTFIDVTVPNTVTDGDEVRVYRKGFGNYPEYDDPPSPGAVPAVPTTEATALGAGWSLAFSTTGPYPIMLADEPSTRDFWYYVAFAEDPCGNVGGATAITGGNLNYHLGDVTDGSVPGNGDNLVDTADITALGIAYGQVDGGPFYQNYIDVGPTTDGSTHGRPLTDNLIGFEDLLMFAINYENVSLNAPGSGLADVPDGNPILLVRTEATTDGLLAHLVLEENAGQVKGIHAVLELDPGLALVAVEEGALLAAQGHPVFFRHLEEDGAGIHTAVLGNGIGLHGTGDIATVRLRGRGEVRLVLADLRDLDNHALGDPPQTTGIEPAAVTPTPERFELLAAQPNPLNPSTTLRFRLPEAARTTIAVYDVSGQLVRTLVDGDLQPGEHTAFFDGRNNRGQTVSSGVYLVRMRAGSFEATQKLQLLK